MGYKGSLSTLNCSGKKEILNTKLSNKAVVSNINTNTILIPVDDFFFPVK